MLDVERLRIGDRVATPTGAFATVVVGPRRSDDRVELLYDDRRNGTVLLLPRLLTRAPPKP